MAARKRPGYDWREPFLQAYAECLTVTGACKQVGISRVAAYDERAKSPAFAAAWAEVEEATTEWAEREVLRRGVEGWVERERFDVDKDGNRILIEQVTKYDGTLLALWLRAHKPEMYRENVQIAHTGSIGHQVSLEIAGGQQPVAISAEKRRAAAALLTEGLDDDVVDGEVVEP
jgi:hypothetical protein